MRIGIFSDTYIPQINGVSTSIEMLRKGLEKKGHKVYIITVNPDNMKYIKEDRVLSHADRGNRKDHERAEGPGRHAGHRQVHPAHQGAGAHSHSAVYFGIPPGG